MRKMTALAVMFLVTACGSEFETDVQGPSAGDATSVYDGGQADAVLIDASGCGDCEPNETPVVINGQCRCESIDVSDAGNRADTSSATDNCAPDTARPDTSPNATCYPGFRQCPDIRGDNSCYPTDLCAGTSYDAGTSHDSGSSNPDGFVPATGCTTGFELVGYLADGTPICVCERDGYVCHISGDTCACDPLPGTDAGTTDSGSIFLCELDGYDCDMIGDRCYCTRNPDPQPDAGQTDSGSTFVCERAGYDCHMIGSTCLCSPINQPDAGVTDSGSTPVCQLADHTCHLSSTGQCICVPIITQPDAGVTDSGSTPVCQLADHVCVLTSGVCVCEPIVVPSYCPAHSHANNNGDCECDDGYHMVSNGTTVWCEPGGSGSTACFAGEVPAGDGWCRVFVPDYQALASHPCDGQSPTRACFLDEIGHDGITDTLCVQGYGLVQHTEDWDIDGHPNRGAPYDPWGNDFTEYLEGEETDRSYSDYFGSLYTYLPTFVVGPNDQTIDMSPNSKARGYSQDGFVCKDFTPNGNFRAKLTFVSQYSRLITRLRPEDANGRVYCHLVMETGVDDSYVSCPDYDHPQDPDTIIPLADFQAEDNGIKRCLILSEKAGLDPLGICPIKADGSLNDLTWHHIDTFCASPATGTTEEFMCLDTGEGYWLKVRRDAYFGLATW